MAVVFEFAGVMAEGPANGRQVREIKSQTGRPNEAAELERTPGWSKSRTRPAARRNLI
jgi:hypothetical protein